MHFVTEIYSAAEHANTAAQLIQVHEVPTTATPPRIQEQRWLFAGVGAAVVIVEFLAYFFFILLVFMLHYYFDVAVAAVVLSSTHTHERERSCGCGHACRASHSNKSRSVPCSLVLGTSALNDRRFQTETAMRKYQQNWEHCAGSCGGTASPCLCPIAANARESTTGCERRMAISLAQGWI